MTVLTPIDPIKLATQLKAHEVTLVDIREADEYAREHIDGAVSVPLSRLEQGSLSLEPKGAVVFHCKSGMRTNSNCARLAAHVDGTAFMLEGGLDAWKRAGLSVRSDAKAPIELNRQVQITIGALMLIGVTLGTLVNPLFILIPAALGAGLLFAGLSGWCGMAHLLALAPWNKRAAS
jgi:rhodanese-related sulfurtransferase